MSVIKKENVIYKPINIFHVSWLENALNNFKNQNQEIHMIDGNITIKDFINEYCNMEYITIIK